MTQREAFHDGRLAHARFAGQDRIVLAAPRQDVDHLADLEIAAQHRIDLAVARVLGEIHGELIQVRRLAAAAWRRRARRQLEAGRFVRFRRVPRANPARIAGNTLRRASGSILRNSLLTSQHDAATALRRTPAPESRRRSGPGPRRIRASRSVQASRSIRSSDGTERGRAGIAALQPSRLRAEFSGQARFVHAEMLQDAGEIRPAGIQQFRQEVLDLHVIMGSRQTQAGRALQRRAHGVVQLGDDRLQGIRHMVSSLNPIIPIPSRRRRV